MGVAGLLACHLPQEAFVFWPGLGRISQAVHDDVCHVSGGGLVFDVGVFVKGVEERHQVGAGSRSSFGVRYVRGYGMVCHVWGMLHTEIAESI